jgi:uncharacterized GH25 family protein
VTIVRAVLLAALALAATALHAHDSWFAREGDAITLVTGTRYPRAELVPPPESFAQSHCVDAGGGAKSCWAELREFNIVLDDRIVDVYLREVRPDDVLRARWQALHASGKQWVERYRKFARIEIATDRATPAQRLVLRQPARLDLEILPAGDATFASGAPARFVVLSQGAPVAGLPVELVSEKSPLGIWSRTDPRGEVTWPLPFPGGWLVRTILLEPDGDERWKSRFATFAFEAR